MGDIAMDSIPSPLLYKIKKLAGLSKQNIKIVPSSGQHSVNAGQKIIVSLPSNTLVDLSTLMLVFTGSCTHAGGKTDCYKRRFFPRNIASIIENLEIKMGGQTIQNINQYGYLYNILYDLTQGKDGESRRKIGENADPSCTYDSDGTAVLGYCAAATTGKAQEEKDYCIRSWLGFLGGNASTNVIDTSMTGQIDIEITLASASCLMEGSDKLLDGTDGVGAAATAAVANYTLKNISLTAVKYDMPSWYYDSIRRNLEAGAVYPIYYPNYSSFYGATTIDDKTSSTRFSVSTSSLDMVIGTFQPSGRTTIGEPLNHDGTNTVFAGALPAVQANGAAFPEFDTVAKYTTINQLVSRGLKQTFNQSKYFQRTGNGITKTAWTIGHVQLNPSTLMEQYNNCLTSFGVQNDTLGGISPLIQSLYHFKDTFYCDILSTKFVGDNDGIYSVSGLDSKEQIITIGWDVTSSGADGGGVPVLFACYNSHVDIQKNRFVQYQA